MDSRYYNRIDYKGSFEHLFKIVCKDFNLGNYKSHELVPFGYEDFNVLLNTNKGTFFVKIFGSYRSKAECEQYVRIMQLAYKQGINYPFLYESKQGYFYEITIDRTIVRLVIQQFIDGQNFIQIGTKPTKDEQKLILQQASLINQINFKPNFVYDSWAIINFEKEFEEKGKYLLQNYQIKLHKLLNDFSKIKLEKLPHCFVHGDIMSGNIMRDKNGKIYILDFAVSQYYPRITELATLIACNFFDSKEPEQLQNIYAFTVNEYQKYSKLQKDELNALPIFIQATFAMYLLRANYEKVVNKNNSKENEHWLKVGITGI